MKRFHALDSFRGLCALSVAVFHLHIYQSITQLAFFRNAHYLVSFFFVLSGFVMMHTYGERLGSSRELKAFAISRVFRLYPLHVATLLFAIALEVAKLMAEHRGMSFAQPSFSDQRATAEILPNLLLIQAWWPGFSAQSFNYPAWSISIECWTYLIFALLLMTCRKQALLAFAVVSAAAFGLLATGYPALTGMVWQGLSCFFAGALTYRLYGAVRHSRVAPWLLSALEIGCLALVLAAMTTPLAEGDSPRQGIALSLLFCAVILVFAFDGGVISKLLHLRPFEVLGQLSYSIYMTHSFVIFFATLGLGVAGKVLGTLLVRYPGDGAPPTFALGSAVADNALLGLILASIVAVSALSYRLVELKGIEVGKYLNKRRGSQPLPLSQG